METQRWRVGRKNPHNLYRMTSTDPTDADEPVGAMFQPVDAIRVATAINFVDDLRKLIEKWMAVAMEGNLPDEEIIGMMTDDLNRLNGE